MTEILIEAVENEIVVTENKSVVITYVSRKSKSEVYTDVDKNGETFTMTLPYSFEGRVEVVANNLGLDDLEVYDIYHDEGKMFITLHVDFNNTTKTDEAIVELLKHLNDITLYDIDRDETFELKLEGVESYDIIDF